MKTKDKRPIVFGQMTPRQAEDLYRFGTITTILIPDEPKADFDLPGYPPSERARLNEIADRWRAAYCGNFLRADKDDGSNWLVFDCGDHVITTDHVHASEMVDQDDITAFVCNAPEDVKWLLQMVLELSEKE